MHRTTIWALMCLVVITASAGNWFQSSSTFKGPKPLRFQPFPNLKTEVTIYVLEIPEVSAAVGSIASFLTGVREATKSSFLITYGPSGTEIEGATNITYNLAILSDWKQYRDLILTGNNFILVNSHADYLPVPAGYNQTQWFDNVLDAISNRFVTWVHVEGFPFYHAWIEGRGPILLGTEPFHQLASLAGLQLSIPVSSQTEYQATGYLTDLTGLVGESIVGLAQRNYARFSIELPLTPLQSSPAFRNFYSGYGYYGTTDQSPGVVVRVNGTGTNTYGLYVHLVPETFSPGGTAFTTSANDTDLVRGAVGVAMPLEWQIVETLNSIALATKTIDSRQAAGRTNGLDIARRYLSSAQSEFQSGQDLSAWLDASKAASSALKADLPWPQSILVPYWPYVAIIIGITLLSFFLGAQAGVISFLLSILLGRPGGNRKTDHTSTNRRKDSNRPFQPSDRG